MRLPSFRFTIGQLIALIAALAMFLAVLRAPMGPLILVIGITLAGFAIDRSRGGAGFRGGSLASILAHLGVGVFQLRAAQSLFADPSARGLVRILLDLSAYVIVGWIWGVAISAPAWLVVSVNQSWRGPEPPADESFGPLDSRGLEDPALPDARLGGRRL
jgi:hypothetical protein